MGKKPTEDKPAKPVKPVETKPEKKVEKPFEKPDAEKQKAPKAEKPVEKPKAPEPEEEIIDDDDDSVEVEDGKGKDNGIPWGTEEPESVDLEQEMKEAESEEPDKVFSEGGDVAEGDGAGVDDDLLKELEASAAADDGKKAEDATKEKEEPVVLVPVTVTLNRDDLLEWMKKFSALDHFALNAKAGNNFVEIIAFDSPHRFTVVSKFSNLETEALKKDLKDTGFIPLSNKEENIKRHVDVVGGKIVSLSFDGKDITVSSGTESSTFSPDVEYVKESMQLFNLFKMESGEEGIKALGVTYSSRMVFDKGFADLAAKWKKFGREYLAFIVENDKVKARFISDMDHILSKTGAVVDVKPIKISARGVYNIGLDDLSVIPMMAISPGDELTLHFFSDDHPYIVTTKGQTTTMVISSNKPTKKE